MRIYIIILSFIVLAACQKPDEAIVLKPTTNLAKVGSVKMGNNYTSQIYYNLENDQTQQNDFLIWDIAFSCSKDNSHVLINGGKEVQITNTNDTSFFKITAIPAKPIWLWDNPNGNTSKTAFGELMDSESKNSKNFVYLIDRGMNEPERYKKIKITKITEQAYYVQFSNLDNTNLFEAEIYKDEHKNYVYLNLSNAAVFNLEPNKDEWDILFTRYRHIYYNLTPITPYSVTGVLLNPNNTVAYRDSLTKFDDINVEFALKQNYSNTQDIIGYDWKTYDFGAGRFDVRSDINYLIKSSKGIYYKLRFIDFYDEQGLKGAPKFEIQKL